MNSKGMLVGLMFSGSALLSIPASAEQDMKEMMQMVQALKARVEQLEYQLAQQSRNEEHATTSIKQTQSEHVQAVNQRLEKLEQAKESDGHFGGVEFHGVIEVEATSGDDRTGADGSDVALATVELGFDFSAFDNWVTGTFMALHEDDDTDPWEVDQAFFIIGNTQEHPLYLAAGRMYVPFGNFETNLVSDPLTLELAETRETAIQLGFEKNNWYGSGYVFNGDVDKAGDDEVENYGFNLGYAMQTDGSSFDIGFSWMNHIGDADGPESYVVAPVKDYVAAYGVHGIYRIGPWTFIGEYITAADSFNAAELPWKTGGAEPSAYSLEVGYDFEAFGGRESNIAFGIQGTQEAVALELPEDKWLAAFSTTLFQNTSLAIEYASADDYNLGDGGTGEDGDTLTLQVAVEF